MAKDKSSSSKKSSKQKPSASGKKAISKTSGPSKSTRSKVSSSKSSKTSSQVSSRIQAKPVASSQMSKSTKRSAPRKVTEKSKSSKKKPPTSTKTKSVKSKKVESKKVEETPQTDTSEVVQAKKSSKKKSSSGQASRKKAKPEAEEEAGGGEPQQEQVVEEVAKAAQPEPSDTEPDVAAEVKKNAKAEDGENQPVEEGAEGEEGEKPAEETLEFTKPTINQMKKAKKEKPLSMAEKITSREFEQLFDEVSELNSGIGMLKHSYGSIIKSLVAMQNRRAKKKAAKEAAQRKPDGKVTFLTTLSTCDPNDLRTKSCLEAADKYDIERFLNPATREETFQMLFDEVEDLNKSYEKMRPFHDARGRFLRDKYQSQDEVKLDRVQFNEFKLWTKKLASIVDDIARNYNDDLLNMFRIN